MSALNPKTTALILIDLQNGIVAMPRAPHSSEEVVKTAIITAEKFRQAGAPVILVNVGWQKDGGDKLTQKVDKPNPALAKPLPENWSDIVEGLAKPGDIHITKHQWGAFHGTDLDLQLRRRNIKTIVLGGIATNMGVESTARAAWEHGYEVIIIEDATSSSTAEMHEFAIKNIFPLIAQVAKTSDITFG